MLLSQVVIYAWYIMDTIECHITPMWKSELAPEDVTCIIKYDRIIDIYHTIFVVLRWINNVFRQTLCWLLLFSLRKPSFYFATQATSNLHHFLWCLLCRPWCDLVHSGEQPAEVLSEHREVREDCWAHCPQHNMPCHCLTIIVWPRVMALQIGGGLGDLQLRVGIYSPLSSISVFSTDLNQFKLHSVYWGILEQRKPEWLSPADHLAITPKGYSRR